MAQGDQNLMRTFKTIELNIHPAGWPFIAAFAGISALLTAISGTLGMLGWILTAWCVYFFRDPDRVVPSRPGLIVAPGDGILQAIVDIDSPPAELGLAPGKYTRLSTFLSVFDVHVNRFPLAGKVVGKTYIPGKFVNAALDKASEDNERLALRLEVEGGREIGVVQIAGLIARRILCFVEPGFVTKTGERFGLIRFGSRVDVYLPAGIAPLVIVGQRMVGGETVLADLNGTEPARQGDLN